MIKVIKQGTTKVERWPYTIVFRCWTCGCEFTLEQGDNYRVETISSGDQREDGDWAHVDCPNCGLDVWNR